MPPGELILGARDTKSVHASQLSVYGANHQFGPQVLLFSSHHDESQADREYSYLGCRREVETDTKTSQLRRRLAHLVVGKLDQITLDRNLPVAVESISAGISRAKLASTNLYRKTRILGRRGSQGR